VNGAPLSGRRAVLAGVLVAMASSALGDVKDLARAIPNTVLAFAASGKDAVYDRKTLYDYMDGGAEVILAFDFKDVLVRKFKDPAGEEIDLDIYDMGSAAEAFGIFSCDRQSGPAGIGQESEYGSGLLRFRQGRYFVSIMTPGDETKAGPAILALGKEVAARLGPPGAYPNLLALLPGRGLVKNRTSFFHDVVNLNNRFFIASENILFLNRTTDCALAEYPGPAGETVKLLLVRYPKDEDARAAHQSFLRAFLREADASGAARTENHTWTLARLQGTHLAIVFDAPTKAAAEALQSAIRYPVP
jgi:hypothetical protein